MARFNDDIITLASAVVEAAKRSGVQIATAESCTGGLISGALTSIPGSSAIFDRGFITYSNAAKREMLGISQETLDAFGAVSENIASEMATGALAHSNAQLTVSVTGVAGPGGSEHKPEGRVCFGLAQAGHGTHTYTVDFGAVGRDGVREATVLKALNLLHETL